MLSNPPKTLLPKTLALDFDGVLCDGLREYFLTSWRAYRQFWSTSSPLPPSELAETFYRLRPVITTGWEMPVLLRAMLKGFSEAEMLERWPVIRDRIMAEEDLQAKNLGMLVDGLRDQWIAEDLPGWLGLHRFYPGVTERLQQLLDQGFAVVIITTKETRFVQQLLQREGIQMTTDRIFGKDRHLPKVETLRGLQQDGAGPIWFVEDLLPTLEMVKQQADLPQVELFLADWGYNTSHDRRLASSDDRIHLLSLAQFCGGFPDWLLAGAAR